MAITFFFFLIYFWLRWVFVAACGLSLVVASGGYSLLQCVGFSLQWLLLLRSTGSRCTGFSSCSTWAQQLLHMGPRAHGLQQLQHAGSRLCGLQQFWCVGSVVVARGLQSAGSVVVAHGLSSMWDLPGAETEPVSPALAGGFLTTAPPGKSLNGHNLLTRVRK